MKRSKAYEFKAITTVLSVHERDDGMDLFSAHAGGVRFAPTAQDILETMQMAAHRLVPINLLVAEYEAGSYFVWSAEEVEECEF